MNGAYPLILFVELSDSTDSAATAEVGRWLGDTHLPDLVASEWVLEAGNVYRRPAAAPAEPAGRFLTISPADRWDIDSIVPELARQWEPQWRAAGRVDAHHRRVWADCFRLCGPTVRPSSSAFVTDRSGHAPVTGLVVIESTAEPTSENQLNDWYNRRRVPEIMREGPFHTAYRYAAATRVDGRRRFLQLFETDTPAPDDAIARFFAEWRPREPVPAFVEERTAVVFAPAW